MTYNTNDIETLKKLNSFDLDTFKDFDILYVTGESLDKYPELLNYGFYYHGFIVEDGKFFINTRKHWWQFWALKESPAIKFIYNREIAEQMEKMRINVPKINIRCKNKINKHNK